MKTLTEFQVITLKNAAKTRQDLLASGKTAEELPQALGEALKLEGDKLMFLVNALDLVGEKTNDLKRVLVFSLNEGEKAPGKAEKKGDHYYVPEYYTSLNPPRGRGDDKRGKKGGGGRRGGRDNRDRGPRKPAEGPKETKK